MKRILSILCCLALVFCLTACGKKSLNWRSRQRKHTGKQQYPDFYKTTETLLGYARAAFLCRDL